MNTSRFKFLTVVIVIYGTSGLFSQTVPSLVNYQGRLSNPDGTPLATADYQLTFNIYDATNGGNLIWGPQIFDGTTGQGHGGRVPVVQGYFNVMLGPSDTTNRSLADAFNATNRYVEIKVGTNSAILPRQQILTAPFAFQAAKLAGYDWSSILVSGNNPEQGQIAGSKIQNGGITLTNLAPRPVLPSVGVGGLAVSADSGTQDFTTQGVFDVTNLTVTITTTGRPVYVGLTGGTNNLAGAPSYVDFNSTSTHTPVAYPRILRGNELVYRAELFINASGGTSATLAIPPSACTTIDFPPVGTWVYKFQIETGTSSSAEVQGIRLFAFEL